MTKTRIPREIHEKTIHFECDTTTHSLQGLLEGTTAGVVQKQHRFCTKMSRVISDGVYCTLSVDCFTPFTRRRTPSSCNFGRAYPFGSLLHPFYPQCRRTRPAMSRICRCMHFFIVAVAADLGAAQAACCALVTLPCLEIPDVSRGV